MNTFAVGLTLPASSSVVVDTGAGTATEGGAVQLVEHAGHLVWLDQPDVCADAIRAFLTDGDQAAA
jgi:pimeloyl-ACP methyl ester carboxylesterase